MQVLKNTLLVLIETLWNVNSKIGNAIRYVCVVLIETLWNVNNQ